MERKFVLSRTIKDNPNNALRLELKSSKESFGRTMKKRPLEESLSSNDNALLPRRTAKTDEGKIDVQQVRLPKPVNSEYYSPQEACEVFIRMSRDIENQGVVSQESRGANDRQEIRTCQEIRSE